MDGFKVNGVSLFLGQVPGRKGMCFYFVDGCVLHPVAYVQEKNKYIATEMWLKMHDEKQKQ